MKKLAFVSIAMMSAVTYANDIVDAATTGVTTLSATVTSLGVISIGIAVAFAVTRVARKAVNRV